MHTALVNLASGSTPRLEYVYRHAPPSSVTSKSEETLSSGKKTYLSGYGVALDLKKTDYLAVDDRGRRADIDGGLYFDFFICLICVPLCDRNCKLI